MITTVQKWGNSLGIRIPMPIARETHLHAGSCVDVREENETVVIAPIKQPGFRLDELLKGINKNNIHQESDFGAAEGKEIW